MTGSKPIPFERPAEDFSTIRIDPVEDANAAANLTDKEELARFTQRMRNHRIAWVCHYRSRPVEFVQPKLQDPLHLWDAWRRKSEAGTVPPLPEFLKDRAWMYHLLFEESRPQTLARTTIARRLAASLGLHKKVLLVGAGVGTYLYPFAEQEHEITAVEQESSGLLKTLRYRARQDYLDVRWCPVANFNAVPALAPSYDLVVMLDFVERGAAGPKFIQEVASRAPLLLFGHTTQAPWSDLHIYRPWCQGEDPREKAKVALAGYEPVEGSWEDRTILLRRP